MREEQAELMNVAQQGDTTAIAQLINQAFDSPDMTAQVSAQGNSFAVQLIGQPLPPQVSSLQLLLQIFTQLQRADELTISIESRPQATADAEWQAVMVLPLDEARQIMATPYGQLSATEATASKWRPDFQAVVSAVGNTASTVGQAAAQGSSAVSEALVGTAKNLGETAIATGSAIGQTSVTALNTVGQTVLSVPQGLNVLMNAVDERPELKGLSKVLKMDWLLEIIDRVDVVKAEKQVRQLQAKYPDESSAQIARRIMTQKALYVSSSGLASGLLPGFAAAMIAVDLATTTALQAEMGYQIACAYGFNVRDEARKGEILAIFGLALGSNQALKTGFRYLARGIPIAGAVIGASSNAVSLYAVGHAAAQYYEAKRNSPDAPVAMDRIAHEESIQNAAAQQILMDQILTHIVVAGYPEQAWEVLEPELAQLNLSPATLQIIQQEINHPAPLEQLVDQLDEAFATFLLAQCQRIAELDEVVNEAEAQVLDTIAEKLAERPEAPPEERRSLAQNIRRKLLSWRDRA